MTGHGRLLTIPGPPALGRCSGLAGLGPEGPARTADRRILPRRERVPKDVGLAIAAVRGKVEWPLRSLPDGHAETRCSKSVGALADTKHAQVPPRCSVTHSSPDPLGDVAE